MDLPRTLHELIYLAGLPAGFADLQPRCALRLEDLGDPAAPDLQRWLCRVLTATSLDDVVD